MANSGTVDPTFTLSGTGFDGAPNDIVLQPNGKIIVTGNFTSYGDGTPHLCGYIARLNADGTFDSSFLNGVGTGFDNAAAAIALQPDGKIVVGGIFTSYNDGTPRNCNGIARLNADGTFDTTFVNGVGTGFAAGTIFSLVRQPDGKIIAGGDFVSYNDGSPHICSNIARLSADGNFDTTFVNGAGTGFTGRVFSMVRQINGKIIAGGDFTSYDDGSPHPCGLVARLNADGTFDSSFLNGVGTGFAGPGTFVISLALQPDGKVLAGGGFFIYVDSAPHLCTHIARLNANGTFDTTFINGLGTGFNGPLLSLTLQPDGKVIAGGFFTTYADTVGHFCGYAARLNADGTLDTDFIDGVGAGFDNFVNPITLQKDGKVIIGGDFGSYSDGTPYSCGRIIRLNAYTPLLSRSEGNFGMMNFGSVFLIGTLSSLTLAISSAPADEAGSMCVSPSGDILIRRPDGSFGTIS